jgi:energy-coupling factor transporter ATP-binding protein EcfA2
MEFKQILDDGFTITVADRTHTFYTHSFALMYTYTSDTLVIKSDALMIMLGVSSIRCIVGLFIHNINGNYRDMIYEQFIKFFRDSTLYCKSSTEYKIRNESDIPALMDYKTYRKTGNIIALCGHAQSGKSTAANIIAKFASVPTYQLSFAYKLKAITAMAFDESISKYENNKTEKPSGIQFTRRELLQKTAEFFRAINPDVFVGILEVINPDYNYIVTDLRFLNEAKYIKSKGGIIIKIEDKSTEKVNGLELLSHEKEIEQIVADITIDNTEKTGLDDYQKKIITALAKY